MVVNLKMVLKLPLNEAGRVPSFACREAGLWLVGFLLLLDPREL